MKELDPTTLESSELVEQTFEFWFEGKDHIRSPFPEYIRAALKKRSIERFFAWASGLNSKAEKEINDSIIGEKLEEIIFNTALGLVATEDEKITINYPFMPRIGDKINHREGGITKTSVVLDRSIIKEGDQTLLNVRLEKQPRGERWETKFELPA